MCRKITVFLALFIAGVCASVDCMAQYDHLKFGDFGVESVAPYDSMSVKGRVWVDVENPLAGFSVTEIYGRLYKNGVALIEGKADDYYVPTGNSRITLTGIASLCPDISVLDVLALVFFQAELYTVDIRAVITDDGSDPVIKEVTDMPVLTLLKKDENE